METLVGVVNKIIYDDPKNDFKVFQMLRKNRSLIRIAGEFPVLLQGTKVEVHGKYKTHPKYGVSFNSEAHTFDYDKDAGSICLYIQSIAKWVGPERAWAMAKLFGDKLQEVIEKTPERLSEVEGIGEKVAASIAEAWEMNRDMKGIRIFLHGLGLTQGKIKRIVTMFGPETEDILKDNPWRLYEHGFGFSTCDHIANKLEKDMRCPVRFRYFILHVLKECLNTGHLYLYPQQIIDAFNSFNRKTPYTFKEGDFDVYDIAPHIKILITEGYLINDSNRLYQVENYFYENESARLLTKIQASKERSKLDSFDVEKFIKKYENRERASSDNKEFELSEAQRDAVRSFVKEKVLIITGGPGTGKTQITKALVQILKDNSINFELMTPTGISAKKLGSAAGSEAYTIHRRLGYKGAEWGYNSHVKYATDAVIVDEGCLPYKQFVNMADGSKEYIGSIVNQKKCVEVLSFNEENKCIEPKKIIGWFKYPLKRDLLKIEVSKSRNREKQRTVKCTVNHKIYTEFGKKLASEITIGDMIAVKGRFLSDFQKSVIFGTLLGDASISYNRKTMQLVSVHGQNQLDYIRIKQVIFKGSLYKCRGGYLPEKFLWRVHSPSIDDLDDIFNVCYKNSKKSVSVEWLNRIDAIGLAMWYMDDGSITSNRGRSKCALFHTEGFSKEECKLIVSWFDKSWGIKSSVYTNGAKGQYYIRLTCASSIVFWDIIAPWCIPSMNYKFPSTYKTEYNIDSSRDYYKTFSYYPVQSISRYIPKGNTSKFVYDICVEGNHNYYSNNVLVSNSMVDQEVFYRLISALNSNTRVVFVGDNDQLPSVGPGCVLRELINSGLIKTIFLNKIFRQEHCSDIIKAAKKIRDGDADLAYFSSDKTKDIWFIREKDSDIIEKKIISFAKQLKDRAKEKGNKLAFQIISPRNQGPLSVETLNLVLQEALNPKTDDKKEIIVNKSIIRKGDRVMIRKNNYELGVFNGDIGKVVFITMDNITIDLEDFFEESRRVEIPMRIADDMVKLAYVLTVHKSQGLEYPMVILPFIKAHGALLLQRNLLYTALTRAKKKVIVLGQASAIESAILNDKIQKRNTRLAERLKEWIQGSGTSMRNTFSNYSSFQNSATLERLLLLEERGG